MADALEVARLAAQEVRDAQALVDLRRKARDRAFKRALEAGATERDVADVAVLSPAAVHRIVSNGEKG